jgi:dTDP-4-amino-4,6-dideoxygalactose transaminase
MSIPLLDLPRFHAPILADLTRAMQRVMAEGRYIMGPEVARFEEEVAGFLGTTFAIGVSSGTDALRLALAALAKQRGPGRVFTTPYTFIATAEAAVAAGFEPVFIDIDPLTGLMDTQDLPEHPEGAVGLLPVHLFGQCVPMQPLMEYARKHNLWVVEDAAQSFGATCSGSQSGTLGRAGCFSFFPSKNLGAAGDAGLVVTDDPELAEMMRAARIHGVSKRKYYSDFLSGNFRLDTLQAALLLVKLPYVTAWNTERGKVADRYDQLLYETGLIDSGCCVPLAREADSSHVFHQYVVRAENRDLAMQHLQESNVGCAVYYPVPLHLQPAFAHLGLGISDLPASSKLAAHALALPVFPGLTSAEQEQVIAHLADFYGNPGACQ